MLVARLTCFLLLLLCPLGSALQVGYPKLAPFEGVRWRDGVTECRLEGKWVELISIDGTTSADLLAFCEETWPGKGEKRFGEDLVEALARMGAAPGKTVALEIRGEDGKTRKLENVAMTAAKRNSVRAINNGTAPEEEELIVLRDFGKVNPAYAGLSRAIEGAPSGKVSIEDAIYDLMWLEHALEKRFSYLERTGVDLRAANDAIVQGLARQGGEVRLTTFALWVERLLALFGDGHTRVGGLRSLARPGYLPCLLAETEGGIVAFRENRRGFVDGDYPYLAAIDGDEPQAWIDAARDFGARGSGAFERNSALRNLRYLAHLRAAMGRPEADTVELTLANSNGEKREIELRLAMERAPVFGSWPRTETRRLEGGFGYLRVDRMSSDPSFLVDLRNAMHEFRDTRGLIIDVRANGGGSRDALRLLLPFFLPEGGSPAVVNVAAYRLPGDEDPHASSGYLDNRGLFPANWRGWPATAREAIAPVAKAFEPEWKPRPGHFSDWHYMVVGRDEHDAVYSYSQPVVLLIDTDCFSATDIFAAAFADCTDATLIGMPTGGGSGRSRGATLPRTGISVRISSMASFRPDGRSYDGRGVEPDLRVQRQPEDLIGQGDHQLDRALDHLNQR